MLYFSSQRDAHQRKRHLPSRLSCSCPSTNNHLCCRRHPLSLLTTVRLSENRKMVEMVEKFSTWASLKLVLNPQKFANPWFIVRWTSRSAPVHQSRDRSHPAFFASAFALEHDFSKVVRVDLPLMKGAILATRVTKYIGFTMVIIRLQLPLKGSLLS